MNSIPFKYLFLTLVLLCYKDVYTQAFYNNNLHDINNNSINLISDSGKKIMFIIVPVVQSDSLVQQVKGFAQSHPGIKVIGLLSVEDGYSLANLSAIISLYAGSNIQLSEGLYTRKGTNQSPFMQWLTDKTKNTHFDLDAKGIGQKYFINERGRLYAVIGKEATLSSSIINRVINTAPPTM